MNILNLTQHDATEEQTPFVRDLTGEQKTELRKLLTFDSLPTDEEMLERAEKIATIADSNEAAMAMIGGAPFFMSVLEQALKNKGVVPVYAFSLRRSSDVVLPDGTVKKTSVFVHIGFKRAFRA